MRWMVGSAGRQILASRVGTGGDPGSESGTCFHRNRSCRLGPAHQGMKMGARSWKRLGVIGATLPLPWIPSLRGDEVRWWSAGGGLPHPAQGAHKGHPYRLGKWWDAREVFVPIAGIPAAAGTPRYDRSCGLGTNWHPDSATPHLRPQRGAPQDCPSSRVTGFRLFAGITMALRRPHKRMKMGLKFGRFSSIVWTRSYPLPTPLDSGLRRNDEWGAGLTKWGAGVANGE